LLEKYRPFVTPLILAKLLHVATLRYLKRRGLVEGVRGMRRYIAREGYPREVLVAISDLLEAVSPGLCPSRR